MTERFTSRGTSFVSQDQAANVTGVIVVVDVLRAFTTAAILISRGADRLALVTDIDHARALKRSHPEWLLAGERDGLPIEGFDLSNSPTEALAAEVRGGVIVQRTTSGTRAVALAASSATRMFCASLVCAQATAAALGTSDAVTYVLSGRSEQRRAIDDADDDLAVAQYIDDARFGPADSAEAIRRVTRSKAAAALRRSGIPETDIDLSVQVDAFPAVLAVANDNGALIIRPNSDVPGC